MAGFRKAVKEESKLRLGLIGPSGSGKTYTAITFGSRLAKEAGGRLAVIDTERGSASKYADIWDFDVLELESFEPQKYIEAIGEAQKAGYQVLVIDSLSHAWSGKGGALEMVDAIAKRSQSPNSFGAWRDVTPLHNRMVDAILSAPMHVIVTLRAKMEYVQEKDERTGKTAIRKIGLQPVQRDGLEYEFDIVGDMTIDNELIIGKSRCPDLAGKSFPRPSDAVAEVMIDWLHGAPPAERPKPAPAPAQPVGAPRTPAPLPQPGSPADRGPNLQERIAESGPNWRAIMPVWIKALANSQLPRPTDNDIKAALGVANKADWLESHSVEAGVTVLREAASFMEQDVVPVAEAGRRARELYAAPELSRQEPDDIDIVIDEPAA